MTQLQQRSSARRRTIARNAGSLIVLVFGILAAGCAPEHRFSPTAFNLPEATAQGEFSTEKAGWIAALERQAGLETVLRMAAGNNPRVYAAWYRFQAAREQRAQMTALPDPKLEAAYFFHRGDSNGMLSLSQEIPFPTKLSLAGEIADREAEAAALQVDSAVRDAIADAKEAWFELYYIDRAQEITRVIAELYRRYAALAAGDAAASGVGEGGPGGGAGGEGEGEGGGGMGAEGGGAPARQPKLPELFRAQSQLAQLEYDRAMLQEMRVAQQQRLLAVLGLQPETPLGLTEDVIAPPRLNLSLGELRARTALHNQDLQRAAVDVAKSQQQVDLAGQAPIPDFMVGVSYEDMKMLPSNKDPIGLTVGISLPLWWNKYSAQSRQARNAAAAAQAERVAMTSELNADLAQAFFRLNNSSRLVRLYAVTLLPQARQAQRSVEELYRKGEVNLASVLETTAALHNFELAHLRATADFYQNVARVEKQVGAALELTPPVDDALATPTEVKP